MNLFVLVGAHHLRPVGDGRAPIPLAERCDALADVVGAVLSWPPGATVVAVLDRDLGDPMRRWLAMAVRVVPAAQATQVVVHRSVCSPLGAEIALGRLLRAGGIALAPVLAVEQLARLESDLTSGVIRRGGWGRPFHGASAPMVEMVGSRSRQVSLDAARAMVPPSPTVLRFTRHGGAPESWLEEVFPLVWLDVSVEERLADLGDDERWRSPAIEFAFDHRPGGLSVPAVASGSPGSDFPSVDHGRAAA